MHLKYQIPNKDKCIDLIQCITFHHVFLLSAAKMIFLWQFWWHFPMMYVNVPAGFHDKFWLNYLDCTDFNDSEARFFNTLCSTFVQ